MKPQPPTKKCCFKGCAMQVPDERDCCNNCLYEVHVRVRKHQGFTREEARIEWERDRGLLWN